MTYETIYNDDSFVMGELLDESHSGGLCEFKVAELEGTHLIVSN